MAQLVISKHSNEERYTFTSDSYWILQKKSHRKVLKLILFINNKYEFQIMLFK